MIIGLNQVDILVDELQRELINHENTEWILTS